MFISSKLFPLREQLAEYERQIGLHHLSEIEKAVVSFILSNETTITEISTHPYFAKYSLSTIKRAVQFLLNQNIISKEQSSEDARMNKLCFCSL